MVITQYMVDGKNIMGGEVVDVGDMQGKFLRGVWSGLSLTLSSGICFLAYGIFEWFGCIILRDSFELLDFY